MRDTLVDLADHKQTALLLNHIRTLKGLHRVTIIKYRKRRSNDQNAYLHGVVVPIFADWCRENGNNWTNEEAKSALKQKFLKIEWPDDRTGEILEAVRDTSDLDTQEFSIFIDQCRDWIEKFTGCFVPPPDPFYATHDEPKLVERKNQ